MKLHRIYAKTARITQCHSSIRLDLDLDEHQRRQAICELLLSMPESDAYCLLDELFPEWLKEEA